MDGGFILSLEESRDYSHRDLVEGNETEESPFRVHIRELIEELFEHEDVTAEETKKVYTHIQNLCEEYKEEEPALIDEVKSKIAYQAKELYAQKIKSWDKSAPRADAHYLLTLSILIKDETRFLAGFLNRQQFSATGFSQSETTYPPLFLKDLEAEVRKRVESYATQEHQWAALELARLKEYGLVEIHAPYVLKAFSGNDAHYQRMVNTIHRREKLRLLATTAVAGIEGESIMHLKNECGDEPIENYVSDEEIKIINALQGAEIDREIVKNYSKVKHYLAIKAIQAAKRLLHASLRNPTKENNEEAKRNIELLITNKMLSYADIVQADLNTPDKVDGYLKSIH